MVRQNAGAIRCTTLGIGLALGALLQFQPPALSAQDSKFDAPWKDSFYPLIISQSNDFPILMMHFEERKAADYFARSPYAGLVDIEIGSSTHGTRFGIAEFHAPLLWERWRLTARVGAARAARFGYFSLGNDSRYDPDSVSKSQPFFYRAKRSRYFGSAELSRQLHGPFYVAASLEVENSRFNDLPMNSLFRQDFGTKTITDTDVRGRLTLVLDTRDNEFDTRRGIFAEASVLEGSGGDGYTRFTGIVRGYVPLREGTTIAARLGGSGMTGKPPLNALFEVPTWESSVPVYGGVTSNRGYDFQRLAGEDVLIGNLEVRHDLLNLGDFGAFTLLGFVDAGRVFQDEPFKLTTDDLLVGYGGGLAIRILRFSIWTFNFAGGDDGFKFNAGTGWAF